MGKNVFSVPIFFIVFRETLEAAIIVSVLLGLVEQIAYDDANSTTPTLIAGEAEKRSADDAGTPVDELAAQPALEGEQDKVMNTKRFIRRMRWQIFLGSGLGFLIALAIGAAFIAVWFTKASNLWANTEELWEGEHCLPCPSQAVPPPHRALAFPSRLDRAVPSAAPAHRDHP